MLAVILYINSMRLLPVTFDTFSFLNVHIVVFKITCPSMKMTVITTVNSGEVTDSTAKALHHCTHRNLPISSRMKVFIWGLGSRIRRTNVLGDAIDMFKRWRSRLEAGQVNPIAS